MFLLLRFIPALLFIIIGTTLSLLYWYPNLLNIILIFNTIITVIGTTLLIQKSYLENKNKKSISYLLLSNTLPIFLIFSTNLSILFINSAITYFSVIFIMNLGLFLYLETNFLYLYYPGKYQINSRENITHYLSVVIVFLFSSSLFGFSTFLNTRIWKIMLAITLIIFILQVHSHWIYKIKHPEKKLIIFISTLIIVEFIYSIILLPSSIYVNAAFVTLIYYLIQTFNLNYYANKISKKFVLQHIISFGVVIALLALTARWT